MFAMCLSGGLASCVPASADPQSQPSALDLSLGQNYAVVVTDSTRRTILVDMQRFSYCAEPSPDVSESSIVHFANSVALALDAVVGLPTDAAIDAGLRATSRLALAAASVAQATFTPTQGAQLYRIGAFNLCQAWMNNAITREEFARQHESLLQVTSNLILAEVFAAPLHGTRDPEAVDSAIQQMLHLLLQATALLESGAGLASADGARGDGNTQEDVSVPLEWP
jgi:hypothetical protein